MQINGTTEQQNYCQDYLPDNNAMTRTAPGQPRRVQCVWLGGPTITPQKEAQASQAMHPTTVTFRGRWLVVVEGGQCHTDGKQWQQGGAGPDASSREKESPNRPWSPASLGTLPKGPRGERGHRLDWRTPPCTNFMRWASSNNNK